MCSLEMYSLLSRLYPICRSLTGDGVRKTLAILQEYMPDLKVYEIPSGTSCLDWTVPQEWNIWSAWIEDESGNRWVDFAENNLHVVGYSLPINKWLTPAELDNNLYSLPEQPEAIPYVTSYYTPRWGFCVKHSMRERMVRYSGRFHAVINSELKQGALTYGELILPGKTSGNTSKEILLSTYICHPSMANDNLSGPVVATFLAQWLIKLKLNLTYRILFIPETLGSIVYLSQHIEQLKASVIAGYVLTCCGDGGNFSFLSSRAGNSLADRVARHVLKHYTSAFTEYSFLNRGSDERNWCSPGVDLPVASIMRSKYGTFPEYHTSLDNLDFVKPDGLKNGLKESLEIYQKCLEIFENNHKWQSTCLGEPQLGKRGLYPTLSRTGSAEGWVRDMKNVLAYSDGENDLLSIAEIIGTPFERCLEIAKKLIEVDLLKINN